MREASPLTLLYPPGSRIGGRYLIKSVLGRGSMSTVFEAVDEQSEGRPTVALKILEPVVGADPSAVERFEREANFCSRLNHKKYREEHRLGIDRAGRSVSRDGVH